jgi:uncharacterized membrane-anchored protein
MNIAWTRPLLAAGTLLVLGGVNALIAKKESIKRSGDLIYLDLIPVDPRSLMQGDYMTLNFQLARQIDRSFTDSKPREGETRLANIVLDEKRIASFSQEPTATSQKLRYRIRKDHVWLGTNAFFFEERSGEQYQPARYGEFRLDRDSGEALLVGLRDKDLKPLVATK